MASESRPTLRLRPAEQRTILLLGDLVAGILAISGGVYFWAGAIKGIQFSLQFFQLRVPIWFYFLPLAWMFLLADLYHFHRAANWQRTIRGVSIAALVGALVYLLVY